MSAATTGLVNALDADRPSGTAPPMKRGRPPEHRDPFDRARYARNVVANWIGHFVFIIGGFIMPRLISDELGKAELGVWDFGWSVVGYLSMLTFGVASSVNRYVAKHQAEGNIDGLNASVSACSAVFLGSGTVAILATAVVVALLPMMIGESLGGQIGEAQQVVAFLGLAAALEMPLSVYNGVITGMQRYALANIIKSGVYIATVVVAILLVVGGGSIPMLAGVMVGSTALTGALTYVASHRVCPGLRMSLRGITRKSLRDVVGFGGKTLLVQLSRLFLYQSTSVLIMCVLGPVQLALFSRPLSLLAHAGRFLQQFAYVATPTASEMQARGEEGSLRSLFVRVTELSLALALPVVLVLAVMGTPLLRVWMGEGYNLGLVTSILAVGHLGALTHHGTICLLSGVNAHGRAALTLLIASIAGLATSVLTVWVLDWGLVGAAIGMALCQAVAYVVISVMAARVVRVRVGKYARDATWRPVLANAPFLAVLLGARMIEDALLSLCVGACVGGLVLVVTYWYLVVPEFLKQRLRRRPTAIGQDDGVGVSQALGGPLESDR